MIQDELARIVDEGGALEGVHYFYAPAEPAVIRAVGLIFASGEWLIGSDSEDASLELGRTDDKSGDIATEKWQMTDVSDIFPWANAIGRTAMWAKLVEDQYGAPDSVQFEFVNQTANSFVVQVTTLDEGMELGLVIPLETPYLVLPDQD